MKAAVRTLFAVAIAAVAAIALLPYWRATAMILRAADRGGWLERAARWDALPVTDRVARVPTPEGDIRVRIFQPATPVPRAALLVSGVHPDGIDDARLVDLARNLAETGVSVVTPEIPDLMRYRLTARVTDTIEHVARWLAAEDSLAGGRPIGMIGVSFSGGLSIVAAGRPDLREHVAYVLSFGGHGNLPRVLDYLCTGVEPAFHGDKKPRRPPHDYALAVLLHQAADLAVPADQVVGLRSGLDIFLEASARSRWDQKDATALLRRARAFQAALPEPSATLLQEVYERDVAAVGSRLLPYLRRLGQAPALSPDRSAPPAAPVYLLHGSDDNVIPAVETELLAEHLRPFTRVRPLISGFLTHVDLSSRPTLGEAWQMIAFWTDVLTSKN